MTRFALAALTLAAIAGLGGHDLSCWCPLETPCHADFLLRLANPSTERSGS